MVTGRPVIREEEHKNYSVNMPISKRSKLQKKLKELAGKEGKLVWEIIYEKVMEG